MEQATWQGRPATCTTVIVSSQYTFIWVSYRVGPWDLPPRIFTDYDVILQGIMHGWELGYMFNLRVYSYFLGGMPPDPPRSLLPPAKILYETLLMNMTMCEHPEIRKVS